MSREPLIFSSSNINSKHTGGLQRSGYCSWHLVRLCVCVCVLKSVFLKVCFISCCLPWLVIQDTSKGKGDMEVLHLNKVCTEVICGEWFVKRQNRFHGSGTLFKANTRVGFKQGEGLQIASVLIFHHRKARVNKKESCMAQERFKTTKHLTPPSQIRVHNCSFCRCLPLIASVRKLNFKLPLQYAYCMLSPFRLSLWGEYMSSPRVPCVRFTVMAWKPM